MRRCWSCCRRGQSVCDCRYQCAPEPPVIHGAHPGAPGGRSAGGQVGAPPSGPSAALPPLCLFRGRHADPALTAPLTDPLAAALRLSGRAWMAGWMAGCSKKAEPAVEVLLLVPWIVLRCALRSVMRRSMHRCPTCALWRPSSHTPLVPPPLPCRSELDRLKDSSCRREAADCARHALRRLRVLTAERDSGVKAQPAAEHSRVGGCGSCGGWWLGRPRGYLE